MSLPKFWSNVDGSASCLSRMSILNSAFPNQTTSPEEKTSRLILTPFFQQPFANSRSSMTRRRVASSDNRAWRFDTVLSAITTSLAGALPTMQPPGEETRSNDAASGVPASGMSRTSTVSILSISLTSVLSLWSNVDKVGITWRRRRLSDFRCPLRSAYNQEGRCGKKRKQPPSHVAESISAQPDLLFGQRIRQQTARLQGVQSGGVDLVGSFGRDSLAKTYPPSIRA